MRASRSKLILATVTCALTLLFTGVARQACSADSSVTLQGTGATFPAPLYQKWFTEYSQQHPNVEINYQALGSGAGIKQFQQGLINFGASDAAMTDEQMAAVKEGVVLIPMTAGSVVLAYNLPDGPKELKLSREAYAGIFLGKITQWNDPRLVALNPKVKLPGTPISPVHRADGSGTTFVFTSYLSAVSPSWKSDVGAATSVNWPQGSGARGNDGVAATTHNTPGGIGYVENAYATRNHLTTTQLRNKDGHFVSPSMTAFTTAAAHGDWAHAANYAVNLIDQPGELTWPIVSATFIELPKDAKDPARSANVIRFFDWAYRNGDSMALDLEYVPLPLSVKNAVRNAWHSEVKGADGKPLF